MDNLGQPEPRTRDRTGPEARREQINELNSIAQRAVVKPESLTMGQVQELGWGFLTLVRKLPDA